MNTPTIPATVARLRQTFDSGKTRPIEWRLAQLAEIERAMRDHETDFAEALQKDLGKCRFEAVMTEMSFVEEEAKYARKHLRNWMRHTQRADADDGPAGAQLHRAGAEGRGADHRAVELPAVHGRRAARRRGGRWKLRGHEAVGDHHAHVRPRWPPSCRATSTRMRSRSSRAAFPETTELLEQKFDHILYTGNERVAQHRHDGGCEAPDAGHARARRQEPVHHRQERRYRSGGVPHRLGQVHQRGPDLRRAGPRARAPRRGDAVRRRDHAQDQGFLRRRRVAEPGLLPHRERAPRGAVRQAARRAEDPSRRPRGRGEALRRADHRARPAGRLGADDRGDLRAGAARDHGGRDAPRDQVRRGPSEAAGALRVHQEQGAGGGGARRG